MWNPAIPCWDCVYLAANSFPVAVEENTNNLILPYTKPCFGTFVVRIINVPEEVARVRKEFKKDLTLERWRNTTH